MKELIHLAYKESFLMKYRDFGNTGIKVSEIGFGSWPIGGNSHGMSYGPTDDKDSQDALNKAFELGCNFLTLLMCMVETLRRTFRQNI
ncbi:MAG: hypothetical protein IPP57_25025 [Candidatus Obscuribacter sp.]|nr:hypothetical protein [Candidatus Obscuribacter sp.]